MAFELEVPVKLLTPTAKNPTYAHSDDAGADLYCDEEVVIAAGGGQPVSTGVSVAIPEGYVGLVHPRSGLAAKHGVTVLNAPGTIDAGYRGEIKVILMNHGPNHVGFRPGDRIAQLVIQKVERAAFANVEEHDETVRGENGFGSTG